MEYIVFFVLGVLFYSIVLVWLVSKANQPSSRLHCNIHKWEYLPEGGMRCIVCLFKAGSGMEEEDV